MVRLQSHWRRGIAKKVSGCSKLKAMLTEHELVRLVLILDELLDQERMYLGLLIHLPSPSP